MEETLVSFEVAKLLKEKGFEKSNIEYYYPLRTKTKNIIGEVEIGKLRYSLVNCSGIEFKKDNNYALAPTQSLAQKWLREVHNIHIQIIFLPTNNRFIFEIYKYEEEDIESVLEYETYELALEAALKEALTLI